MGGFRTRGQPGASEVVRAFLAGTMPHALLLAGPPSVGKTTLGLDIAAALLCAADDPSGRPCRACRPCRMVDSGNHPDLHRVGPEGAAGQVGIGRVRELTTELSLLPVEGGARVAVVEAAHRMNEDAQNALLKTLEEPPAGVTIVLCADEEERLLPTVRSRCARVRLGPVGSRDIETILGEAGVADAALAGRLARLARGRPGLAMAYALSGEAATIRAEVARSLVDLLAVGRAGRLVRIREIVARADVAAAALAAAAGSPGAAPATGRARGRARGTRRAAGSAAPVMSDAGPSDATADEPVEPAGQPDASARAPDATAASTRGSAADRRRASGWLLETWTDLARDLAALAVAGPTAVRDTALLDELVAADAAIEPGAAAAFLPRLARAGMQLEANVSPELLVDVLVLAWPRARVAA
jgi:DNA polymerase-3 subunit delta'